MLVLVPVTLPPCAQAAHTSVTHIHIKELRNKDKILPNQACFRLCTITPCDQLQFREECFSKVWFVIHLESSAERQT